MTWLRTMALALAMPCIWSSAAAASGVEGFEIARRLPLPQARQGIAVDALHLYAIDDRAIGKYEKRTGARVALWREAEGGRIVHLNSGVVLEEKLYCAHSNYPSLPMVSSIEIFDTATLSHVGTHELGIFEGSAAWVDRHDGSWWVGFANYTGKGGEPGRGPETTAVVRFDSAWRAVARYTFPLPVIERFGTRSNSGGAWGADGLLYATGHDAGEVYVLRLPQRGSILELVEIVPAALEGQGIAWDRSLPGMLWGIRKSAREAVALLRGPGRTTPASGRVP